MRTVPDSILEGGGEGHVSTRDERYLLDTDLNVAIAPGS